MKEAAQPIVSFAKNSLIEGHFWSNIESDFSNDVVGAIQQFQRTHPDYKQTPLHRLEHMSSHLGVNDIFVKDESHRFGLNAFKVLGGIYAIGKYLAERLHRDIESLSFAELTSEEIKSECGELTFITATDGNHGKGVAWAARELGHRAIVYLPKGAAHERVEAIRREGADVH